MQRWMAYLTGTLSVVAFAAQIVVLAFSAFSTTVLWGLGRPLRYMIPFAGVALVFQVIFRRRVVARGTVAVLFLALVGPYWHWTCPQCFAAENAKAVGDKVLAALRDRDVHAASLLFVEGSWRQDFEREAQEGHLIGLQEWRLIEAMKVFHEQGSAEFDVTCADGAQRHVEIEVYGQYFLAPVACSFYVLADER